jgi:uncharacterized Zn-finger protein
VPSFSHKTLRQNSLLGNATVEPRRECCDQCPMYFKTKRNLRRHKHNFHRPAGAEPQRFECGCGKTYTRKDNLQRHKRTCKPESVTEEKDL